MKDMSIQVVLTGPYAGQTKVLNRHQFVNGMATLHGQPENVGSAIVYLGRCYQAYPVGSPELARALERDKANGIQHPFQTASTVSDRAPAPVQGAVDRRAGPVPEAGDVQSDGHVDGAAGSSGLVSDRTGHEDAGMGQRMESAEERESSAMIRQIRSALQQLDPKQDTHWTPEGLPSLDTVAEAANQPGLLRSDLEAVFPGWTRSKAAEVASL